VGAGALFARNEPECRTKVTFLPQFADNSQAVGFRSLDITGRFI